MKHDIHLTNAGGGFKRPSVCGAFMCQPAWSPDQGTECSLTGKPLAGGTKVLEDVTCRACRRIARERAIGRIANAHGAVAFGKNPTDPDSIYVGGGK